MKKDYPDSWEGVKQPVYTLLFGGLVVALLVGLVYGFTQVVKASVDQPEPTPTLAAAEIVRLESIRVPPTTEPSTRLIWRSTTVFSDLPKPVLTWPATTTVPGPQVEPVSSPICGPGTKRIGPPGRTTCVADRSVTMATPAATSVQVPAVAEPQVFACIDGSWMQVTVDGFAPTDDTEPCESLDEAGIQVAVDVFYNCLNGIEVWRCT